MKSYKSYGLSQSNVEKSMDMLERGVMEEYPNSLEAVDDATLDAWISESEETPYVMFLLDAKKNGAKVYTYFLKNRKIGEIAIF